MHLTYIEKRQNMKNNIYNRRETQLLVESWRNLVNEESNSEILEEDIKNSLLLSLGALLTTVTGCATSGNLINNSPPAISQPSQTQQKKSIDLILDILYDVKGIDRSRDKLKADPLNKPGVYRISFEGEDASFIVNTNILTPEIIKNHVTDNLSSGLNTPDKIERSIRILNTQLKEKSFESDSDQELERYKGGGKEELSEIISSLDKKSVELWVNNHQKLDDDGFNLSSIHIQITSQRLKSQDKKQRVRRNWSDEQYYLFVIFIGSRNNKDHVNKIISDIESN